MNFLVFKKTESLSDNVFAFFDEKKVSLINLQTTCPEEHSQENFENETNSEKVGKSFGLWSQKNRRFFQNCFYV